MEYLVLYIISMVFAIYMKNTFSLSKKSIIELAVLPLLIPVLLVALVEIGSKHNNLEELLFFPFAVIIAVLLSLPLVLIPAVLITKLKEDYKKKPVLFFIFSTLIGGLSLSIFGDWEPIVVGMLLAFFSVLIQYVFLDKKNRIKT